MEKSAILKEIQSISREGELYKLSRFLKSWRKRWVVLTNNLLLTYKQRRVYQSPTEIVVLKEVVSIKTIEDDPENKNTFKLQTKETSFYFTADTVQEKEQWIGAIGKAMVQTNNRMEED